MDGFNIEIKARIESHETVRKYLEDRGARFVGSDHQVDTYFKVPQGRMKLREGTVESCLVWYDRPDEADLKPCAYRIVHFQPGDDRLRGIREVLGTSLGVAVVVDKRRDIYRLGAAKFHLDMVAGLGCFFEIEAIGASPDEEGELRGLCNGHLSRLGVSPEMHVAASYADLAMQAGDP